MVFADRLLVRLLLDALGLFGYVLFGEPRINQW